MMVVAAADQREIFEESTASFRLAEISIDEARAHMPVLDAGHMAYAAYADHAWDIDTDLLLQNFSREARANAAQIITAAPVSKIERDGQVWRVETPKGVFEAKILVNAAGAWADGIARIAGVAPVGLTPMRRSMARIPAPGGMDVSKWPTVFGVGETWYSKPDAGALIVSPAEEDAMQPHDAWADDMVLAEGLARYEEFVSEPVTRLLSSWAGLRTFSPDRILVIGRDPAVPSFFWLAGQGGYGFQTSSAASQPVADLIDGRAPQIDADVCAALSPARFN